MQTLRTILLAILLASTPLSAAQPQTGSMHLTFTERSPLSPLVQITKRRAFKHMARGVEFLEYDIGGESFEAFVPTNYKSGSGWGIFVFVSAGDAQLTPGWGEVFAKRKLIWICANNSGNGRDARIRMALALDAVHNLRKMYDLAEQRTYIAGFSG